VRDFLLRGVVSSLLLLMTACFPAGWGASWIVHPNRKPLASKPDLLHEEVSFTSGGLVLKGWKFRAQGPRRGWIFFLHGISDNRESGLGMARRFVPLGYDVLVYDGRAHGESSGTYVTYGFHEKADVVKALDAVGADRAVLFGCSLGASVALQAAPLDPRIEGVIAQAPFADLRTIVHERKPWVASVAKVNQALQIAERRAAFRTDDASALRAAPHIQVPVLLIHGALDRDTRIAHSQRIYDALGGPKEMLALAEAGHNDTLTREETWKRIEEWLGRLSAERPR
jgi:uncharacterized protein